MRPSNTRTNSKGKFERVQQNRLRQNQAQDVQDKLEGGTSNDFSKPHSWEDSQPYQSRRPSNPATPQLPTSERELSPVEEGAESHDTWDSPIGIDGSDSGDQRDDEIFPTERNSLSDARASRIIPTLLELESENARLTRENRNLVNEKLQAEEQSVNLSRDRDELQNRLDSANRENAIARASLERVNALVETQDSVYAELLEENKKFKERNGLLTQEVGDLHHRETELIRLNAALDDNISTIRIERTRLLETLSETLKKTNADREILQAQLKDQRDETNELKETLEAVQEHLEQAKEQQLAVEADLAEADRRVLLNRSAAASLVGIGNLANELADETMNSPGFVPITPGMISATSENSIISAVRSPGSRVSFQRWPYQSSTGQSAKQYSKSTSALEVMTSRNSVSQPTSNAEGDEGNVKPTPTELFANSPIIPSTSRPYVGSDSKQYDSFSGDAVQGPLLPATTFDPESSYSGSEQAMSLEEIKALMPTKLITSRTKPDKENSPIEGPQRGLGPSSKHKPPPLPIGRSSISRVSYQSEVDENGKSSMPSPLHLRKRRGAIAQSKGSSTSSWEQQRGYLQHLQSPSAAEFARRSMTSLLSLLNSSIRFLGPEDHDTTQLEGGPDNGNSFNPKEHGGGSFLPSARSSKTESHSDHESSLSMHWIHGMPSFNSRSRSRRATYSGTGPISYTSSLSTTWISPRTTFYGSRADGSDRIRDETIQTDPQEKSGVSDNTNAPVPEPMQWRPANPVLAYLCSMLWSTLRWTLCGLIPPWLWFSIFFFLVTLRSQCFSANDCHQWYASNERLYADVRSWRDDIWALPWLSPIRYDMSRKWNLADTLFM